MDHQYFFKPAVLKKLFVLSVFSMTMAIARSQNPILLECMNINKAYLDTPYLSFNIKYKYAFEATPGTIEDSSSATYKTNKYKYWATIDSVEYMQNDSFVVALFKEEKIISLGLPTYNFNLGLPLAYWDSLFFQNERFSYSTGVDSIWKKITVNYTTGLPYKKFEMWYDSTSYRISRIKYVISEFATDEHFYDLAGPGTYGIVDMLFSNYQTGMFGDDVFQTSTYINHSGNVYAPSGSYESYQLYINSPGLLKYGN